MTFEEAKGLGDQALVTNGIHVFAIQSVLDKGKQVVCQVCRWRNGQWVLKNTPTSVSFKPDKITVLDPSHVPGTAYMLTGG